MSAQNFFDLEKHTGHELEVQLIDKNGLTMKAQIYCLDCDEALITFTRMACADPWLDYAEEDVCMCGHSKAWHRNVLGIQSCHDPETGASWCNCEGFWPAESKE